MRFRVRQGWPPAPRSCPEVWSVIPPPTAPPARPPFTPGPTPAPPSRSFSASAPPTPRSPAHSSPAILLPHWRVLRSKARPFVLSRPQLLLRTKSRPLSNRQQRGPSWSRPLPPHLAAAAAEPVAAHGVVGQGALLAAVPARSAALLGARGEGEKGREGGRRARALPPGSSFATSPRRPPHPPGFPGCQQLRGAHLHGAAVTLLPRLHKAVSALGGVQELDGNRWSGVGLGHDPSSRFPRPPPWGGTLRGLLKRQLPPPSCRNWLYSSMLQRENLRGR